MDSNDELLDIQAACKFLGGTKPIHAATFYRGVAKGIYPKPVKIGPNSNRVVRSELVEARDKLIAARDPVDGQKAA